MPETGKQAVRAIVRAAEDDIAVDAPVPDYPAPGEAWELSPGTPVPPGDWVPADNGLPPRCPIYPLGYNGELIFVIDTKGQLRSAKPNGFGKGEIQSWLFDHQDYAAWAWPRSRDPDKKGALRPSEFNVDWARSCFYNACGKRQQFDPSDRVRGRGAWADEGGGLIYHCGDRLYIDGKPRSPGEYGKHFYPARPRLPRPWHDPVSDGDNPAPRILDVLQTWNSTRQDVDPLLTLGWIGSAMVAGALKARPTLVIVGDAGVGKSTMQDVFSAIMGPALVPTVNATGAGIWQAINMDSLAVAIDEFENDPRSGRGQQILDLARQSVYGGVMLRGGADHKGVEFTARSSFALGAINMPPMSNADRSRMLIVDLRKQDVDKRKPIELGNVDEIGRKLLRRLMDGWDYFQRLQADYADVLSRHGHKDRGQDVFATLLASAHVLLGDMGMEDAGFDPFNLEHWGSKLARDRLQIVDDTDENWRQCLTHLLTAPVEAWRNEESRTIGHVLWRMREKEITPDKAKTLLEQAGVGVRLDHRISHQPLLYVPRKSEQVNRLFEASKWFGQDATGVWDGALRQGPAEVIRTEMELNRCRINGAQARCVVVVMDEFWRLEEAEGLAPGDERNPPP